MTVASGASPAALAERFANPWVEVLRGSSAAPFANGAGGWSGPGVMVFSDIRVLLTGAALVVGSGGPGLVCVLGGRGTRQGDSIGSGTGLSAGVKQSGEGGQHLTGVRWLTEPASGAAHRDDDLGGGALRVVVPGGDVRGVLSVRAVGVDLGGQGVDRQGEDRASGEGPVRVLVGVDSEAHGQGTERAARVSLDVGGLDAGIRPVLPLAPTAAFKTVGAIKEQLLGLGCGELLKSVAQDPD